MKKRLLPAFLSLVLCVSMIPVTSFADQAQAGEAGLSYASSEGLETKARGAALPLSGDSDKKDSSVVKLTHGSEVSYYDTWASAYTDASNGDTLTLLKDISGELQLKKVLTINLGGYNLTGNAYVASSSSITLEGEGTLNYLKVHSTSESCSLTVPAGNDKLEIKELEVGKITSIKLSSGKYGSILPQGAPMGSSMDKLLDLLADGYSFMRLNPSGSEPGLVNVYSNKSARDVKVVDHSTHEYSSAASEYTSPGQCYCGYWCQHECGPKLDGDGGCADCFLPLMASVIDDAGHISYYTEFDAAISAALDKGVNKITALNHSPQNSRPEPINLKNLNTKSFTLEVEQAAYLPETTVTVDSPGTSVAIAGGGGFGKVLVKNCAGITFSDVCVDQLEVSDSSVAQSMTFWGKIREKVSLPEGCKVKDLLPDSGYGCKNLADGVSDPWNSINLDTNVIEGNFAIKLIPITGMSLTPAEAQIEVGNNAGLEANVTLANDDYSVNEYKWYKVNGEGEEFIAATASNTLNTGSSLAIGRHVIRCKAISDGYVKSADCVVNVAKKSYVEGDDFTAPVGASDLTYNGKEQSLVSAPAKVPDGARVQYHVGENAWQDEIPTAKNAGTYSVYWKIVGNDQYSDYYEDFPISVSINQGSPGRSNVGAIKVTRYVANTYECNIQKLLPELPGEGTSYGDIQYSINNVNLVSGYYDALVAPAQVGSDGVLSLPIQENKNTNTGRIGEVTVTAKTQNYGTILLTANVKTQDLALDFELTGLCEQENTETFDVGAKLPSDTQITSVEVGASSILSTCEPAFVAGGRSCTIKVTSRVFDEPQSATLPITVKTSNYGTITGTIKITLTGKHIVNIDACPQDALYDGGPHSGYSGTVSATLKTGGEPYAGDDLTYTYTKANGAVLEGAPSEVGDYTLTIAVPESNETYKGSTDIKFSIVSEAEALYQTEADGEWQGGTFDEALLDVYDGGTIKLLKDVARTRYADLVRPVTITSNNPSAPCKIYTKMDQHGYLLNVDTGASAQRAVNGGVKLENIIVDGGSQNGLTAKRAAIAVTSGHLTLGSGAVVQNNTNTLWKDGIQSGIGGGICVNGGALTLGAGSVVQNNQVDNGQNGSKANGVGGGIGIYKGTLVIDGGCITGNEAVTGGGVYLWNNGSIELKSGSLKKNTSRKNGAAVYVNNGNADNTFVMTGGTISENTASASGGGVFVANGTFVMKDGAITSNSAQYGGGAFVNDDPSTNSHAIFKLSGGSISNNTAANYAGGVICAPGGEIRLSGSPFITKNSSSEEKCGGIYLNGDGNADADVIIENALTDRANISFYAWKEKNDFVIAAPGDDYSITSADKSKLHYPSEIFGLKLNDAGNVILYKADFIIEATAHGNGSISPSGDMGVFRGDSVEFTIVPGEGSVVKDMTVNWQSVINDVTDSEQSGTAVKTYVLENIQNGAYVDAYFEEVPSGGGSDGEGDSDDGADGDDADDGSGGNDGSGETDGADDSVTPPSGSSDSDQPAPAAPNEGAASKDKAAGIAETGDALGIAAAAMAAIALVAAGIALLARRRGGRP